jgi:hypothetical protein
MRLVLVSVTSTKAFFILPVHKNVNARYALAFFAGSRPTAID